MESTLSVTATMALLSLAKTLNSNSSTPLISHLHRRFSTARPTQLLHHPLYRTLLNNSIRKPNRFGGYIYLPRSLGAVELHPARSRLECVSNSAASFASGGGGFGGNDGSSGGGGGGGDSAAEGGEVKAAAVSGGADDVSALASDVIILDVGGMTCGGCAASVKRILENQPQVSSASVNLTTETAVVWPVSEAKDVPNWQTQLGEALAKHLTRCGFKSNLRDSRRENFFEIFDKKMNEKHIQLKESGRQLVVSWALCAVCLIGHLSHLFGAKASWIHAFHSTGFHFSLSLFTLLGPGRKLIIDGLKSLFKGVPNMNTLVGLGAISSFAVSSVAAFIPKLDRVPADGIVKAGRSTVDESSFSGEPLPATKLPGAEVAAGSVNLNGTLTIEVRRPGGETSMGDIVRLVEEAQTREAPVQRLADKIAGHFTYGVMALSAATFVFWNLFGARVLPAALHQGSPVSLALQLSCSVLVVACPCALGLATPTAVLVGTSLGANRGLLVRGGSVLERFSAVNTIVFDKTGTLTLGRPVVTKVITQGCDKDTNTKQDSTLKWSEADILRLAAGVETNTNHPVGKAIVDAARAANCLVVKAGEGTFMEEPGSGAVATVENRKVSVGTLDWIKRHDVAENPLQELEEYKNQSAVYVGIDGDLAGIIYVEDQIREDAKHVVESLSKQGMSTYLLSGDKKNAAEYVASVVGIPKDKVLYEVKPDQKKKFISRLQQENIVAMVGDGINDAAALSSSHVGVAIGGGVGAASEVSSVVLMHNRLSQLLDALELSRLTMNTVKQNLWWAFAYNIVGIPIASGVLLPFTRTMLTPSIAGALMGLSSIGVMTNSLLLRFKYTSREKEIGGPSLRIDIPLNADSELDQDKKLKDLSYPLDENRK